jgi:hypothetical protein
VDHPGRLLLRFSCDFYQSHLEGGNPADGSVAMCVSGSDKAGTEQSPLSLFRLSREAVIGHAGLVHILPASGFAVWIGVVLAVHLHALLDDPRPVLIAVWLAGRLSARGLNESRSGERDGAHGQNEHGWGLHCCGSL